MWQDIAYDADKNIVSLTVATPDKILAQNTYRYDSNGQRSEKNELTGQTLYTYDKLNRLQQAEYPTDTEQFSYDNAGKRLIRTAKDIEEQYIYDVNNRLTSQIVNGRVETYRYDAEGLRYEMEGNEKAEQIPNRYQYTGQQLDPITQQYYLRARFYNPAIARFTQEDEYHGDGINLYAYCANNPVDYYDPSGYDKLIIKLDENIINVFSQEDIEKLMANSIQRNYTKLKSNVASVVEKFYNKGWTKNMEKMVAI